MMKRTCGILVTWIFLGCCSNANTAHAGTLAVWNFDSGSTTSERLAASNAVAGVTVSSLLFNSSGGYGFRDFGPGAVPNDDHDGIGFGGNSGEQVMFLHRANYFDGAGPTGSDYTSFGPGSSQGTTANLGDGNAPVSFTVTTTSTNVAIVGLTIRKFGNNPLIYGLQEAGGTQGETETVAGALNSAATGTAYLSQPVILPAGETRTFTISLNSGLLDSRHNVDYIELLSSGDSINWWGLLASNVGATSAVLDSTVDSPLSSAVAIWDTADKGTTNVLDWAASATATGTTPGTVSATAAGLSPDTQYTYRFYGADATTNGWSDAATFTTDLTAAQTPVFTNTVATTAVRIMLGWQDNASTETAYVLHRSDSGSSGPYNPVATLPANTTSYQDTVAPASSYWYRLSATNSMNESGTDPANCQSLEIRTPAAPAVDFSEDFESPVITSNEATQLVTNGQPYSGIMPDNGNWVKAGEGFGAGAVGIDTELTGHFIDPVGAQAFAFRYSNSGATTDEGVIGALVADGRTYTISFDVVKDGYNEGTAYNMKLVVFETNATRKDHRNDDGSTVLTEVNGNAPSDGNYETITFTYTPDPIIHADNLGKDLAIRFFGATISASIDNVSITDDSQPPGTVLILR